MRLIEEERDTESEKEWSTNKEVGKKPHMLRGKGAQK